MKLKSLIVGAAALAMPATMIAGTAYAATAGQIEGGDIYRVRNVTKGGDFTDPVSADKCETVQFKVRIHNPGPDALEGVKVGATLPSVAATSHSSKVIVTADNANPKTTTDTAGVNLTSSYKINYVNGSTQLLDANGSVMQNLPDGIVGGQVNIPGGVGVSTQQKRFVQFNAKVDCPETPPAPQPAVICDALSAKAVAGSRNKIAFTAKATAKNGAVINGYTYTFGDGNKVDTDKATVEHEYAKAGTYKATVQVKSTLGTTEVVENCAVTVKITEEKPPVVTPPVTPTTPTSLPKTGAGSVIAAVLGASVIGAIGYRLFLSRRLNS